MHLLRTNCLIWICLQQARPRVANSGYLGMTLDLMAPEGKSVYIVSVVEGGPAAKGGLKANDVIVEIDKQPIGGLNDLEDRCGEEACRDRVGIQGASQ